MQLDSLWQFMQVDMQTDGFENRMRQSPNRQKLLKHRAFLKDQQANMKKLEDEVAVMQDRLAAVQDEAVRLEKQLNTLSEQMQKNPPENNDEALSQMDAVQKLVSSLTHYEQELQKMRKDAQEKDRQQKEIRTSAATAKAEYDELKKKYDVEYEADKKKLDELRAHTEEEAKKVKDAALLEKYHNIKQHCTPPMAKLINGQCSGCFMSLPSATLLEIRNGDRIVECDNCGRILYDSGD